MLNRKYLNYILIGIIVSLLAIFIIDFSSKNIFDYYNFLELDITYYLDYVYSFFLFSFFIFLIFNFNIESKYKRYLILAYIFRVFFILFIFQFVENYYYGWDADSFYKISSNINKGTIDYVFSFGNSSLNIGQFFNILHNVFGFGYKTTEVFLSSIVFFIFYMNFYQIKEYLTIIQNKYILLLFLFEPMTIIFTSLYSKDPLAVASILLNFYFIIKFYKKERVKYIFYSFIPVFYFLFIRIWMIPIIVFAEVLTLLFSNKIKKRYILLLLIISFSFFIFFLRVMEISSLNNIEQFIVKWSSGWQHGGSTSDIKINNLRDFLISYPYLLFTTIFRPLIMTGNIFIMLTDLINWIIFILFIKSIVNYKKYSKKFSSTVRDLYRTAIIYILIWGSAYSFISPQNLGTGTRFKIQIWFFMILISSFGFIKNKNIQNRS